MRSGFWPLAVPGNIYKILEISIVEKLPKVQEKMGFESNSLSAEEMNSENRYHSAVQLALSDIWSFMWAFLSELPL